MLRKNQKYGRNEELINIFRKLWEQHVMWTRSFIISTAADLGDLEFVTKRLLRNPTDFANILQKYYGDEKAIKFKKLFEQHLLIAADLVNAAKAGNAENVKINEKKWYANADDIATFLSEVNPYWRKKQWQSFMYNHLKMTENEAVLRLNKKYEEDIKEYDKIESEALKMADYMANGITKHFSYLH